MNQNILRPPAVALTADAKLEKARRKFVKETVADAVTRELRQRIIAGEYEDGAPLRQDALAEELDVSRNPIREALNRLESEGLVASKAYCGYVVSALSSDEISELFDLRSQLESNLIRHSIPRMTSTDFEKAEAILDNYSQGLDDAEIGRWGEFNVDFHMALYEPSRRRRSLDIVRSLLMHTDRYSRFLLTLDQGPDNAKEDHERLLDLCRRKKIAQAAALTGDIIQRAKASLLDVLNRPAK